MATAPSSGVGAEFVPPRGYLLLVFETLPLSKLVDFYKALISYDRNRISLRGMVLRMQVLLRGHKELRLGLNASLPPGYEADVEDEENLPRTLEEAQALLQKIKDRLEESRYGSLLSALEELAKFPEPHIGDIFRVVGWELEKHDDLFEEFTKFLPPDMLAVRNYVPSLSERAGMGGDGGGGGALPAATVSAMDRLDDLLDRVNNDGDGGGSDFLSPELNWELGGQDVPPDTPAILNADGTTGGGGGAGPAETILAMNRRDDLRGRVIDGSDSTDDGGGGRSLKVYSRRRNRQRKE